MAPRVFWKGYLKLSLVTCPVAMTPATTESERVRFHTLNRKTGNRIASHYVDSVTGKDVDPGSEVKGYERGENEYVMLEDDEIDAVALESTHTIDIQTFAPRESIGWIWYDRPHYLAPNDEVGEEAFGVIREAMAATDVVGISRLVMYRRERAVLLEPRGKGIVLWTLRYGDEVRDEAEYFPGKSQKVDPKALSLVEKLIAERTTDWSPEMVADPVQATLLEMIASKKKGRKKAARPKDEPAETPAGNVVNIMDALRKSLAAEGKKGGKGAPR
ncbi:Ku protein [Hansschlegelia beijingensis]|uniref:Non-homologous end joining protein Ku n=1 Tax=Hansschlegelia beijingensis TaxID=1133344 RepID=A0A7W6D123_9HYPH|nr:Ku protein [Hansschlegelia beijingensis]MBB3974740.1 DNA end-binding protein Ku [Hansschlegelia beijingensis]